MTTQVFGTIPRPLPPGDLTTPTVGTTSEPHNSGVAPPVNVRAHDVETFDGLDDFLCEGKRVGKPFRLETGDNKCSIVFYCTTESNLQVLRCPSGQAYDIEEMRCKIRASVTNCNMKIREELFIGWHCRRQPDGLEVCDDDVRDVTGYDGNLETEYCRNETCKNGGHCYGVGLCSCPWDYTGPHCENKIDRTKHKHYSLDILEDGHHFKDSIVVDEDDGIIIYQVPPHGHRIGMTFFVHNSTKLVLEVPTSKLNHISGVDGFLCTISHAKDTQTIEQLEKNMNQAKEYYQDPNHTENAPVVINTTQIVSHEPVPKSLIPTALIKYAPEGCDIRLAKMMGTNDIKRIQTNLRAQPKEYYQLTDFIKEILGKDKLDIYCENNREICEQPKAPHTRQAGCVPNPFGDYPVCVPVTTSNCQYVNYCQSTNPPQCWLEHIGQIQVVCRVCCRPECQNFCPSYAEVCQGVSPPTGRGLPFGEADQESG